MDMFLLLVAFGFAVTDWVAVAKRNRSVEKFAKPLTIITLIIWVFFSATTNQLLGNQSFIWLLVGLFLCLLGDIFLFLPPEKWFLPGLAAFLLGHVGYIFSFGVFRIDSSRLVPALILIVVLMIAVVVVLNRLIMGMKNSGKSRLSGAVVIYSLVITFMVFSAGYKLMDSNWLSEEAILLAGGALLFYISDILNAWERFVSKFKNDRLIIMITYHVGQFGIATGIVLHLKQFITK